jgi:hypothetical protein
MTGKEYHLFNELIKKWERDCVLYKNRADSSSGKNDTIAAAISSAMTSTKQDAIRDLRELLAKMNR